MRRQAVYGKRDRGENTGFCGAPQSLDIFVFRCEKEVTCDKVRKFIEDSSIDVLDIKCVSSDEARFHSFCVTVPRNARDSVMDGDFWPEGVGVRLFRRKRAQFNDNDSKNGD